MAIRNRRVVTKPDDAPNPSTVFGLLYIELEDSLASDVAKIQRRLRPELRLTGRAGVLQQKCGGDDWSRAVADPQWADGTEPEPDALVRARC